MADGTLRRISDCMWRGTLSGFEVIVTFYHQEGWWYHVAHPHRQPHRSGEHPGSAAGTGEKGHGGNVAKARRGGQGE